MSSRPLFILFIFVFIALIFIAIDYVSLSPESIEWERIKTTFFPSYPFDLNQDGVDEFITPTYKEPHFDLRAYRESGTPIWQCNFQGGSYMSVPYLFHFSYQPYILAFVLYDPDLRVHVIDKEGQVIIDEWIATGSDRDGDGRIHLTGHLLCQGDLTGDGRDEIVLQFRAGYDQLPRGLVVYDFYNRKELWRFESGAAISTAKILDVNGDNQLELVAGSIAYDNGAEDNGLSDHNSYLLVFDANGEMISQQIGGGLFSSYLAQGADVDGNGLENLVTFIQWRDKSSETDKDLGRLTVWHDNRFEKKAEKKGLFEPFSMVFDDLDLDGSAEILVSQFDPFQLIVLSGSLELLFQATMPEKIRQILTADFNDDGYNEIAVLTLEKVYVYDHSFSHLGTLDNVPVSNLYTCRIKEHKRVALGLNDWSANKSYIYIMTKPRYVPTMWILAALSGILLGALLMYGVNQRQSQAYDKKAWLAQIQQAIQTLPFAIYYFERDGRLLLCNRQARKQLGLLDAKWFELHFADLQENQIQQAIQDTIKQLSSENKSKSDLQRIVTTEQGRKFKLTAFSFLDPRFIVLGYLVYLVDVSLELKSQQAIEWAVWAQRLAHDIKNPLSIIKLTMQQLEILINDQQIDRARFQSQLNSVMEEVERLRLTADGFMKLLNAQHISQELYQTEAIVPVIIERIKRFLPENISFDNLSEKELPDIEIDLDQFLIVTDNLVANAAAAMPKGGTLSLDIKTVQRFHIDNNRLEQHLIIFEFSDTGVGMSSEQLDKIFEPFYSTTPDGTGLGLAICKKIIAEHNGQLVVQSRKGIGTIVRIEIPITKQKG